MIYNNRIKKIEPEAFGNNIEIIDIGGNELKTIKKGIFTNLNTSALRLQSNQIEHMEKDALAGMKYLECLDLQNNHLKNFNTKSVLEGSTASLEFLNLARNKIEKIEPFTGLNNLLILNLSSNALETIENGVFEDLDKLDLLDLSRNNIKHLPSGAIPSENNLMNLFLHNNNLRALSSDVLGKISRVKNVTYSNNPWQCSCKTDIDLWREKNDITNLCLNESDCIEGNNQCSEDVELSTGSNEVDNHPCYSPYWRIVKHYDVEKYPFYYMS